MNLRASALLIGLGAMGAAGSAFAQEHQVCFEPGTTLMTAAGYSATREAAADLGGPRSLPHIAMTIPGGRNATGRAAALDFEVRLELARNGVFFGRVESVDGAQTDPDCVSLTLDQSKPFFGLWHFWGPYFGPGSDEVTPEWRLRMRSLVVDYRPGETKYCIGGHADSAGSPEYNQALSFRRAENVALELVRQGVRWDDTVFRAYGETQNARPTADDVAEPLNRRAFVDVRTSCPPPR